MNGAPGLQPTCPPVHRPEALLDTATTVAGLRAAQGRQAGTTRFCDVWCYQDPPVALANHARWTITAPPGSRAVAVTAANIVATPTPHVELTIAGEPDVTRYRVAVDPDIAPPVPFDPLRTWLLVRLRPECPDLGSCLPVAAIAPPPPASPQYDFLARDYRSLRATLLEYLQQRDPTADLSVADPTIALLELFAHEGDLLHYRLDRVATEAYLETARLRTSVRRHARLVDFRVKDGTSARSFVHCSVAPNDPDVPVAVGDTAAVEAGSSLAFTIEAPVVARAAVSEVAIYDWGEDSCCLPAGATNCVLVRPQPADALGSTWINPGDRIVFEVVDPGDVPAHRRWVARDIAQPWPTPDGSTAAFRDPLPSRVAQVVELLTVTPFDDPLAPGVPLVQVQWAQSDALARSYPIGISTAFGGPEVTVARANVVAAHHARAVDGPVDTTVLPVDRVDAPSAWWLLGAGVLRDGGVGLSRDADGFPYSLTVDVVLPSTAHAAVDIVPSLLDAALGTFAAVVDTEVFEWPVLRFVTGALGTAPPAGSGILARYEIGSGEAGNVAANALRVLERDVNAGTAIRTPDYRAVPGVVARNPVGATGGSDPDDLDAVRRDAPEAFAASPRRAVLAADYAAAAARDPAVQRAVARRRWAGSWPLVEVVVEFVADPDREVGRSARDALQARLDGLRMTGTEVAVIAGRGVGLFVALEVCVRPGTDPDAAWARVVAGLRPGSDAAPGVFHASRLAMGATIYSSATEAVVAALPEIDAVGVVEFRRLDEPAGTRHEVLTFASDEVPVLDDDPDRPDRGRLDVRVRGGR